MRNNLTVDDFPMVGVSAFKKRLDMDLCHRTNGTASHCDEIERLMTEVAVRNAKEFHSKIEEIREYMNAMVLGFLTEYNNKGILFYDNDKNYYHIDIDLLKEYIDNDTLFRDKNKEGYFLEVK